MFRNYFKTAWKNLLRNRIFSFINITGLSLGLACCMLIILYNKDEVSFDWFHENADNIYRITTTETDADSNVKSKSGVTGMMPGPVFKSEIPEIKDFLRLQGTGLPVKIGTAIFDESALYVDDNFFSVFTFPLTAGNKNTCLKDIHSVVISEEVAKKFFGTADAVGKTIELRLHDILGSENESGFENFTVTGIAPETVQNSSVRIRMLLPMSLNTRDGKGDTHWGNFFLNTFVVLHDHADLKAVEEKFRKVYETRAGAEIRELREKYYITSSVKYGLQPLCDMHLSREYTPDNGLKDGSNPIYTKILGAIALFMLIIACINFVNLSIARSLKRAKEIGIRKVIGGRRVQLVVQFLGESFLLGFFAFILAIILVVTALPFFNSLAGKALSFSYLLDVKLVAAYFVLFVFSSFLAGFYPALILSGFNPVQTLYNRIPFSGKNYLSKGLVVLQFTLTTILIISTITIYTQFNFLTHFDLGYNDKNLVIIDIDRLNIGKVAVFRQELYKDPGVLSVAVRQSGNWRTMARTDGNPIEFSMDVIDSSYLSTLRIPLVKGRNFSADFPSDPIQSVLVNEAFLEEAGWKDINNRQVDFFYDSIKYNVVGVVKNYHYASLMEKIRPQLFIMNPKYDYGQFIIKIKPEGTSRTLGHIEQVFKSQQPFVPYYYNFKDHINARQYASEEKWKQIISFAAILTIFISCIGLFGLTALAAEKRTREIGIRKVLGASVASITTKLSGSFIKLVLLADLIALPSAWWAMNTWLQNYPYRITMGIRMFAFAVIIVLTIALLTIGTQALKAALQNPVKSLRTE